MARVINYRNSRTEEDRDEMSPLAVGIIVAAGAGTGLTLGLAFKSAMSDADAPFEASPEALEKIMNFANEEGETFENHTLRGAGLSAVLTAAPFVKIPTDLDIRELPAAIPTSPEQVIDYIEDHLDVEVSAKQAKKIRRKFEKLEKEFEKGNDEDEPAKKEVDSVDEEEVEDDEEEEE